jgi:LmbE family N-acetylglucosaminyl deacetylase
MHTPVHLILSPHLDDAVLSCGGIIHHLTAGKGEAVLMFTIMAGDPPAVLPDTPIVRELHERWQVGVNPYLARRREDLTAALALGATAVHVTLPEAIYRTAGDVALYPTEESIFGPLHPHDGAFTTLDSLPLPYEDALVSLYLPLGAGHHVDHQLIRAWGLELARRNPELPVYFYGDYPYAADRVALQTALNELAPLVNGLEAADKPLDETDFKAKAAGIACYQSQLNTFWESIDHMRAEVRRDMLGGDGQLAEPRWRLLR